MEKIFKKSLALVLSAALCLTALVGCLTVSAEGTTAKPTYALDAVEGKPGDTVTVTATISNLDKVCAEHIKVTFPAGLAISDITDGNGGAYTRWTEDVNVTDPDLVGLYSKATTADNGTLIQFVDFVNWPKTDGTYDNVVASLVIKFAVTISAEAVAGHVYDITAAVDAADYDADKLMDVDITNGSVTVTTASHEHTEATRTLVNVTDTEFVYDCTCTSCEETYQTTVKIGAEATGTIRFGKTLQPANDISIEFHLVRADVTAYSDFVLVAKKAVYAANETEPTYVTKYITSYDNNSLSGLASHRFVFTDIAGYEMNNTITATVYGLKDGEMHKLKSTNYSVVTFLNNMMKSSSATKMQKDVYVDMAKYGAKSQILAKVNVANLADSFLTEEQLANYGTSTYPSSANDFKAVDLNKVANTTEYGTINLGRTLTLENKINIVYWMDLKKFTGSTDQLYCKFDYYDVDGSLKTYTYQYDNYVNNGYKSFKFDKAPVSTIDYPVRSTVYYGDPNGGGVEMIAISYSIETFFKNRFNAATAEQLAVYKTIYAYGRSLATLAGVSEYVG